MPVSFDYADESDRGRYPVPPRRPVEGGRGADGDRHVIVVDRSRCRLYELFAAYPEAGGAAGGPGRARSGTCARTGCARAAGRPPTPPGCRSCPGWRATTRCKRGPSTTPCGSRPPRTRRAFVYPARHFASALTDPDLPAMGQRLRLKRGYDISRFPRQARDRAAGAQALRDDPGRQRVALVRLRRAPTAAGTTTTCTRCTGCPGSAFEAVDTSRLPRPRVAP